MKPINSFHKILLALVAALAVLLLPATSQAVALAKNNTTTWNLAADWTPAQAPTLLDALTCGNTPMTAATMSAMSLGGNVSCLSVDFRAASDTAANRSLRIGSGSTLTFGASNPTINQSNNKGLDSVLDCAVGLTANSVFNIQGNLVMNNSISQDASPRSLSLNSSFGVLHLNGANSYAGGTTLNLGILTLGSSGTLGATTGNLTVGTADNNPGILDLGGTTQTVGSVTINRGFVLNGTIIATSYNNNLIGLVSANLQGTGAALSANDNRGVTLSGTNTYTGATTLNGVLRITQPVALPNSGASGTITIGNGNGFLALRAGAASGEWDSTTIGNLLANASFTVTAGGGALGIDTTGGDFSYGSVIPNKANMALRKLGQNTLTLSAANLYPNITTITRGTIKVDAGAGGSLPTSSALTFTGTGTLNYDNTTATGTKSQLLGALTTSGNTPAATAATTSGEATVQLTRTAAQTTDLKFASLATRVAGASLNFTVAGTPGVNGTDSKIWFTTGPTASTFIDQGSFFGGSGYAIYDSGNFLRAMNYGSDTASISLGSSSTTFTAAGANAKHVDLGSASSITASTTESINSLRIGGVNTVTLVAANTLTIASGGILKTGGNASSITGGTGLSAAGAPLSDLVIRTDAAADTLTINSPILLNTVTKSGAGTLELNGANTFTALRLNAGKLSLKSASAFPNSGFTIFINEGTTLDNTSGANLTVGNGAANVKIQGSFTYLGTSGDLTLANGNGSFSFMPNDVTVTVAANTLRMEKELLNGNYSSAFLTKNGPGSFYFGGNGVMRFQGGLIINAGVVTGTAQQSANTAGVGPITLGDTSGSSPATYWTQNNLDSPNPVTARAGSSGMLALVDSLNSRWNGPITLNNALTLSEIINSGNAFFIHGVISGASNLNIGPVSAANIVVNSTTSSLANVGTVRLFRANTYTGNTLLNSGTLRLGPSASISNSALVSIAAGATLDVSDIPTFNLSASTTLGAKGTGTTAGTTQATLKGGTSVSLGAQPISLTFTPTSGSGDTTHPSLVVSQGTLTLSSNTISVVNNGPALGAGVYRLIQVTSATTTGVPNTNAVTVTGTGGLAANSTALATVSGGNVILTVTTKSVTSFTGLTGSQTVQASVPNVALSGTISASGPLYPANGETIHVRINGVTQDTTVVGAAGAFSISYATIPPAGGPYPITYTYDGNATLTTATNSATELTVSAQTVPTITAWPTASAITYGQDLTSSTLTGGSASTAGVFTFTAPSTIPSTAGTYAASGTFTPTDTVNFATVVASGVISVSVGTKGLTISSPAVTTKTYTGTAGATITGTLSGVVAGDGGAQINFAGTGTFASSGVANGIAVTSTATLTGTKASSYTLTQPTGLTGNITPATLTVTADNKGRAVGAANPTFTSTTTGFVNSENTGSANVTGAPSLSTTADGTSVEGSYAITCTANTLAAPNYTFTPVDGILYVVGSLTWRAGNGTWDIATSLNWTNSGGATVPYVDAVPTRFDDTATGNPYTVTLNTTVQPGNMTFSGTKDYTITGSGIIGGTASLTNTSGSLTTFTVNNSNSYSGGTFMTAGTVTFGNQYALGSGPVTLTGGMTFQQQGFEGNSAAGALPNAFVLNGTNVTMNMPFGFKDVWLSQVVSGTGGFTVQGGGRQLNLTATNTFSGGIILKDFNNRIVIWNLASLGTGTFRTERLSAVEGVLETAANVSTGAGVANAVDIASGAYLNVDASGNNHLLLSGPITSAVGNGNLNKVSSATLTLSGNNTYSGTTTVTGGKLLVNGANSGAGAVSVASAAYLGGKGSVGGNVTYAAGAFGLFTNGSTFAITGTLTLNANVVHLNVPANLGAGNYILATYNPTGSSGSFASTPVLDSGSVYSGGVATVTTTGGNVTLSVSQTASTATLVVGNSPASYTGSPVAATVTISASSVPGTVANVRYDGSATVPTALGTYAITADFVPNSGNYTTLVGLSAGNFVISQAASAIQLVSSSQTNGYLDSVTFTSAVPAFVNSGSVVFLANNGAFSTNDITSGVAYSLAITNQPRGTNLIVAEYPGDANVVGSTNSLLQVVTNHPPVAVEATYSRAKGTSLKIAITNLLSNVTDGDGDAMTLQSVGAGTNGATILTNNTYVFYLPSTGANSNSNDSFTYTVSDGFGGSATANIMVTAYSAAGSAQMSLPTNNVVNIKFFGIPNYTYIVQTTTNLSVPWWTLSTNTAGSDGSWWFTDPNATNSQQYYRSAQP